MDCPCLFDDQPLERDQIIAMPTIMAVQHFDEPVSDPRIGRPAEMLSLMVGIGR